MDAADLNAANTQAESSGGAQGVSAADNTQADSGGGAQGVSAADLNAANTQAESSGGVQGGSTADNIQAESGGGAQGVSADDLDAANTQAESSGGAQGMSAADLNDANQQASGGNTGDEDEVRVGTFGDQAANALGAFDSFSASELQEFNVGGVSINAADIMRDLGSWMRLALADAQPDVNYNFIVSIGALPIGMFQAVEGIVIQHQPFQWKEGGRNHSPHYLPFAEPKNRGELSLKWGNVINDALYSWMRQVDVGNLIRKEVFVIQMGRHGWPNMFYRFAGCMPVYWEGAALNSGGSSWAIEELKIVYEHTVQVRTLIPTALVAAGLI